MNLYLSYFQHPNELRRKEFDKCFMMNIANPLLNVVVIDGKTKPKYNDYFKLIREYSGPNDINIIANLDIYFDETISQCASMPDNHFYALARYDINTITGDVKFSNRPDSQDVWIIKGHPKNINGDFCLGVPGCDNKIAYEAKQAGYVVRNPSLTIKTYHVHQSSIRDYTRTDCLPGPYLTLSPEH